MDLGIISPRTRILLMIVLPLAILLLFYSLYFNSGLEELNKLKKENQALKEEIDKAQKIAARYEELKKMNEELTKKIEYLKTLLPKETEVSDVLKRVSEQGIQKGLVVTLWRPKGKEVHESKEIYKIPVEVKIKGKYHTFGLFFADISKIERIINVNTIDFKAGNVDDRGEIKLGSDPTMLNASLVITSYSLIPDEEKKKLKEQQQKK